MPNRTLTSFAVVFSMMIALIAVAPTVAADSQNASREVQRITGPDALAVTADAVRQNYGAGQPVTFVVNAEAYADGIAAAGRAAGLGAPIVLVNNHAIPSVSRSVLQHLDSDKIVIVGGTQPVSTQVARELAKYSRGTVERVSGTNRYSTSANLAKKYPANVERVYIAGGHGYPDALTGGGLAGLHGVPLILTRPERIDRVTAAQLKRLNPREIVVLGGSTVVSDSVLETVKTYARSGSVERVAGVNREATAASIAKQFPAADAMIVTNRTAYSESIVAAAITGRTGSPLVLTREDSVPSQTQAALDHHGPARIFAMGTRSDISDRAIDALGGSTGGSCDVAPPSGTMFGANAWDVGKTLDGALGEIDSAFGPVPIVRHFSPGLPFTWDSSRAKKLRGRDLVVSFKVHPTDITSGKHDAFFRNWFATAPSDQTIFWSYFHEPENNINTGQFTKPQYRAAWSHLAQIYDEACRPNMFSTLILTEWTMHPNSNRDYRTYDAGHQAIDMIAFDPYNGVWDPKRDYYVTPEDLLDHVVEKMEDDGRPWGIAEIGSRVSVGDNGTGRAKWLEAIANYARNHDAVFVTYFHAIGNGDWRLNDTRSRAAWREAVQQ